ncbi:hypothetical protein CROQUDRAFT_663096 [Cronartium quercuum f. sp. fusiforme G11]|uniref:DASH complex subunit DAD2 n=1 Tax=Cronartium quercuum f. sp. fusiforme G11 TaxID=708437 RepID=A0A9P6NAH2_9BASI|nr:hypothetical protein CROQUDRAFT_663096 [Cronartium quercuum f. sp. fusiforme G11]
MFPSDQSQPPPARSTAVAQKLKEKQQELATIMDLDALTGSMSDQVSRLSDQFSLGADGLQAIESVVRQFQNVFRFAQLAIAARGEAANADSTITQETAVGTSRRRVTVDDPPLDVLVRIPLPQSPPPDS